LLTFSVKLPFPPQDTERSPISSQYTKLCARIAVDESTFVLARTHDQGRKQLKLLASLPTKCSRLYLLANGKSKHQCQGHEKHHASWIVAIQPFKGWRIHGLQSHGCNLSDITQQLSPLERSELVNQKKNEKIKK